MGGVRGVIYYVMEYLDGLDLEVLVRGDGAQRPAPVVHVLKQVAVLWPRRTESVWSTAISSRPTSCSASAVGRETSPNTPPQSPSEHSGLPVPRKLEALVLACLEKDPEQRPQSADELLAALEALDDVAPWTPADARSWWAGRGRAVCGGEPAPVRLDLPSRTVAVDLREREGRALV